MCRACLAYDLAAAVVAATMRATSMALAVVIVMVATYVGVILQRSCQQCLHCLIGITADTAVPTNAGSRQCRLRTATNAATDQHIGIQAAQQTGQRTVSGAIGIHDSGGYDLAVYDFIDLKSLSVAKMLKNLSSFISNRNFHNSSSSFLFLLPFGV